MPTKIKYTKQRLKPLLPEFILSFKTNVKNSILIPVNNSYDISEYCRQTIEEEIMDWRETFVVIALTRANKICGVETARALGYFKAGVGGVSGVYADIKVIMQFLLKANASKAILCHNHPSGSLLASAPDAQLTKSIKEACGLFEIKLIDHIILTSESYLSMADEGIL